jgi:hypothetical protein
LPIDFILSFFLPFLDEAVEVQAGYLLLYGKHTATTGSISTSNDVPVIK